MTELEKAARQALKCLDWMADSDAPAPDVSFSKCAADLRRGLEQESRDWSLLEATQESLREHMDEIKRLKGLLEQPASPAIPDGWKRQILEAFPLFDDEGLDEEDHHCEWAMQQDRKRLHTMLAAAAPEQKGN